MEDKINKLIEKIKSHFENDFSGHDWEHILRVLNNAKYIQSKEGGNIEIVILGALLHDISDHKMNGGLLNHGGVKAKEIMVELNYSSETIEKVVALVDNISFKGALVEDKKISLEQQIVQDADRLDAIGAVGIARAFAFGGNKNRPIYQSTVEPTLHVSFEDYAVSKSHTINHFYEKLLLLKDRFNTETGKKLAMERHQVMEDFLKQFFREVQLK